MTPWLCDCHGEQMLWQIDTRQRAGGRWECRQKRREYNAKRMRVFGSHIYVSDEQTRKFAIQLREDRKEARRGRA